MSTQACEPCARRKVRCDKAQPCSNCKRRKQDQCIYPDPTPLERIKKLEALVRNLGGDPEAEDGRVSKRARLGPSPAERHEGDVSNATGDGIGQPIMLEEDGQSYYVESCAWHSWLGVNQQNGVNHDMIMSRPLVARTKPNALQSVMQSDHTVEFALRHPSPHDATILWNRFERNVNPLVKIDFTWALKSLRLRTVDADDRRKFNDAEHALVLSIYLIVVVSMSDQDCVKELHQPKSVLLSQLHPSCEQALSRSNILCITDMTVLRALTLYMTASIERTSIQSLWSLMGITIRSAEKLGIHRDGALLGLPPAETEARRRLWWQLQHIDLALGVRSGSTPLTLMAAWDTNMPLNIEDDDINTETTELPKERKGLTSLSYCLWTYWVVAQQRDFFHSNRGSLGLSWAFNKSIPHSTKQTLINRIEDGLNKNFLQYCDPIKPLDVMIQMSARSLVCGMRMFTLLPMAFSGDPNISDQEQHSQLLEAAIKALEYNIAMNSRPELQRFYWLIDGYFPWHAFICVLVETLQQNPSEKTQRIWSLLSDLYSSNTNLLHLSDDRRKAHAAELITGAWKARQSSDLYAHKPTCVSVLEPILSESRVQTAAQNEGVGQQVEPVTPQSFLADADLNAILDFDFDDIDWSFWAGME